MPNPIRVMLVDDHEVVRVGLRTFLETQEGIRVVAEATNGAEAIQRAAEICPDVILMDISMPEMDGIQATRRLKEANAPCPVLVLTVHEDKQYFFQMLAAGASGYLSKRAAPDELVAAIQAVADGLVYLQPSLARWLLEDYRRLSQHLTTPAPTTDAPSGLDVLTRRERQVLELVAEGLTNPQIGERLGISPKTVARHRERIMAKLNLHSRTELVKFAIRAGLVTLE